jgi:hypothetical protein
MWRGFDIGTPGSESGIIARDEEHAAGTRITLERNAPSAPFTITCGIYGCIVHTRFFGHEEEATWAFEDMKQALDGIMQCDAAIGEVSNSIAEFIEQYPWPCLLAHR